MATQQHQQQFRLKDLRRLWARGRLKERMTPEGIVRLADILYRETRPGQGECWWPCFYHPRTGDLVWALNQPQYAQIINRVWDRLMTRYGADALFDEREIRPLATRQEHKTEREEVSEGPHVEVNADTHGGDGNSAEMDHRAETTADETRQAQDEAEANAQTETQSEAQDEAEGLPEGESEAETESQSQAHGRESAVGYLDETARARAEQAARRPGTRNGARLVSALRRLIETHCTLTGKHSPRFEPRALVRELVSRRYALHRAHRREQDIRELVIAVDASGSCRSTVEACYEAALVAIRLLPRNRASIIFHLNGRMIEPGPQCAPWLVNAIKANARGLEAYFYSKAQETASTRVWQAIADHRPGLVLVLGDYDSDWAHCLLHEAGVPVLLMSHLPSSYLPPYPVIHEVVDLASAADGIWRYLNES